MAAPPIPTWAQTLPQLYAEAQSLGWSEAGLGRLVNAHRAMEPLFAGWFRGSGRPFISHLCGTASVLVRHHVQEPLVIAGLCHAAIQAGALGPKGRKDPDGARALVESQVGEQVARLVTAYTKFKWPSFLEDVAKDPAGAVTRAPAPCILLRSANEADDTMDLPFRPVERRAQDIENLRLAALACSTLGWTALAGSLERIHASLDATPQAAHQGPKFAYYVSMSAADPAIKN